jgi:hypothetical protein
MPLAQTPPRVQRLLLRLRKYQPTVTYVPGKYLYIADTLSRASLNTTDTDEAISNADLNDDIEVMIHSIVANVPTSKERLTQLKQMTAEDESLQQFKTLAWRSDVPAFFHTPSLLLFLVFYYFCCTVFSLKSTHNDGLYYCSTIYKPTELYSSNNQDSCSWTFVRHIVSSPRAKGFFASRQQYYANSTIWRCLFEYRSRVTHSQSAKLKIISDRLHPTLQSELPCSKGLKLAWPS